MNPKNKMSSLSRLYYQLEHGLLPIESFYMNYGKDWKSLVRYEKGSNPFSVLIWKSLKKDRELVLKTWLPYQKETVRSFHFTHSRVMTGTLCSCVQYPYDAVTYHCNLSNKVRPYSVTPFSNWTVVNQQDTDAVSLHLIEL